MKWTRPVLLNSLLVSLVSCSSQQADDRPNFLVIMTDDQTFESIHALNNREVVTPNMDRLATNGVVFTHAFNQGSWSGAVCVASRTMLITGQTVFRAPQNRAYLDGWAQVEGSGETEVTTWAEAFTNAGYETFMTGKWHNTDYALLKGFDQAKCIGAGMYETRDATGSSAMAYSRPNGSAWTPWDHQYTGHWSPRVKDLLTDETGDKKIGPYYTVNQHTSELYSDQAIHYLLTEAADSDSPFLMYVAFNAPHDPRQSPKEYVDLYPVDSVKLPANYVPEHPFDQGDHKIRDEKLAPFPRSPEAVRLHRQEYYAIITHFDHQLGRILEALERSGKAENTYVILSSDHGLAVGQHGLMGKQNQYDHSIRMPLIFMGPGLDAGSRVDDLVYMQSIYATTCDLAGITLPATVEFRSLSGLLTGVEQASGESAIFGCYRHYQRMIRTETHKLIVYPEAGEVQLFDLVADPYETTNLANQAEYQALADSLFGLLVQKQAELGDYLKL